MTIRKFYLIFLVQLVLFVFLKIQFYNHFDYQDGSSQLMYWAIIAVATTILVRAIGVLNYLEAIYTAIFWFVPGLIVDLIVTSVWTGLAIFSSGFLWIGYCVMMFFVFATHKRRHVHIKKGLYVDPHGHH